MVAIRQRFNQKLMTSTSSIATRYVSAVFANMQKGKSSGDLIAEMAAFLNVIDSDELAKKVFFNRVVPVRLKRKIADHIESSMDLSDTTRNFISVLINNGRLHYLHEILQGLNSAQYKSEGYTEIRFETGAKLPANDQGKVNDALSDILQCKPKTTFVYNKRLLGGFKLFFSTKMIDKSLKSKLTMITKKLQATEINLGAKPRKTTKNKS